MELFTLGSGYTERDIREAARALTGFGSKRRDDGTVAVVYDAAPRRVAQAHLRPGAATTTGATCSISASATRATRRFSSPSCGTTSWGRRSRRRRARAWRACTATSGHRIEPVVREILAHPALYRELDAPDMVKSPVVYVAGALRAAARGSRARLGVAARRHGSAAVPPAVGRGLGVGPGVAVVELDARALRRRQLAVAGPPPGRRRRDAGQATRRAGGRPRARRGRPALDLDGDRRAAARARDPPARRARRTPRRQQRADMCQRVLRHLLLTGPDAQVH